MRRSESATKRGRSPTQSPPTEVNSPNKHQKLPPPLPSLSAPASRHQTPLFSRATSTPTSQMPAFLSLTPAELSNKYDKLCALEASRVRASKTQTEKTWTRFHPAETMNRDRFNDIFIWKNNRVSLRVPEECCDYVNASPILLVNAKGGEDEEGKNGAPARGNGKDGEAGEDGEDGTPVSGDEGEGNVTKYIAMQAPKRETSDHVWRMIWHEVASPGVIVTLTIDKSHPYFPLEVGAAMPVNEDDEFGDGFHGSVTCESLETSEDGATQIRKLVMRVPKEKENGEGGEKTWWHLLYMKWPDYGVPNEEEKTSLLRCIRLSRELNKAPTNPRVVHCRAGVGRSGTFMALDFLLSELEKGRFSARETNEEEGDGVGGKRMESESEDPVYDTVNRLREQRPLSVQTVGQYRFIYDVLRESWEGKYGMKVVERARSVGSEGPKSKVARYGDVEDVFRD